MKNQWSPLNPEGKKQYDREYLLQLQSAPMSLIKLSNLPKLNIVKDEPHLQKMKSIPDHKVFIFEELFEKLSKSSKGCSNEEKDIHLESSNLHKPNLSDTSNLKYDKQNSQFFSSSIKTLPQSKEDLVEVTHKMEKTVVKKNLEPQIKTKKAECPVFGLKSVADFKLKKNTKAKDVINDFLHTKDFEETIRNVKKLISSIGPRTFICTTIKQVLKESSQARQLVGQLFLSLVKKEIITMIHIRKGLNMLVRAVDIYFASDIHSYVGEVLEPILSLGKKKCRPVNNWLKFFISSKKAEKLISDVKCCDAKEKSPKSDNVGLNCNKPIQNSETCGIENIGIHIKSPNNHKSTLISRSEVSNLESSQKNSIIFPYSTKILSQSKGNNNSEEGYVTDVTINEMKESDIKKNFETQTTIKEEKYTELNLKNIAEFKENEIEIKTKVLIEIFLTKNDFEETMEKVRELISSACYRLFISSSIKQVLKKSSPERWLVGRLIFFIIKYEILTLENYSEGLVKFLESIDTYFASDIWDNIAEILEPLLSLKKNYFWVLKKLLQPFIPSEKAEKLTSALLRLAAKKRGVSSLRKRWESTELQWTDFLGEEANIEEFISKNELNFLASDKKSKVNAAILTEESKKYLFNLLNKHEGVDTNFSNMPYRVLDNSQSQIPAMVNPISQHSGLLCNPFQMQPPLFHARPMSLVHQQRYHRPFHTQQFPIGPQQVFFNSGPGGYNNSLQPQVSLTSIPLPQFSKQMPQTLIKREYSETSLDSKKIKIETPNCDDKGVAVNVIQKKLTFETQVDQRKNTTDVKAELLLKQSFIQNTEVSVPQCVSSIDTTDIKNSDPGNEIINDKKSNIEKNIEIIENTQKQKMFSGEISNNGKEFGNDSIQNTSKTQTISFEIDLNIADKINYLSTHNSLSKEKMAEVGEKLAESPKSTEKGKVLEVKSNNTVSCEISNDSSNIEQLSKSNAIETVLDTQSFAALSDMNIDVNEIQEDNDLGIQEHNDLEIASTSSIESKEILKRRRIGRIKTKVGKKTLNILIKETQKSNLILQETLKETKRSNELLEKLFVMLSKSSS